ncbi:MAG TPA: CBS domain-containing protein [Polyangia bacterium]|nr:CBS domain-containing protein [Polyangia bacterium]
MGILLQRAEKPPVGVTKDATVLLAVQTMVQKRVGAVLVYENDRAVGIFTERDLMAKVVVKGLNVAETRVSSVMTSPVLMIAPATPPAEALTLMLEKHIRHLPVADPQGRVLGMLSIRNLLQDQIDDLKNSVDTLEAYATYDGASG